MASVGKDRVLVLDRPDSESQVGTCFVVDLRTGSITTGKLATDAPKKVVGMRNGDFVVEGYYTHQSGFGAQSLCRYTSAGKLVWRVANSGLTSADPKELEDPIDIAVDGRDEVAVLCRSSIQLFSGTGAYLRTISFKHTSRTDIDYPTQIAWDHQNGWYVFSLDGTSEAVYDVADSGEYRNLNAKELTTMENYPRSGVATDSNGNVWTCGGDSFLQIDPSGKVLRRLSSVSTGNGFTPGSDVRVGVRGDVYVCDGVAKKLSVHSATGTYRDVSMEGSSKGDFAIEALSGDVYVQRGSAPPSRFSRSLRRQPLAASPNAIRWSDIPPTWFWNEASITNGQVKKTIEKWADGIWFDLPLSNVMPNGDLFVQQGSRVGEFSRRGKAIWMAKIAYDIPNNPNMACDGRLVYLQTEKGVTVFNRKGQCVEELKMPPLGRLAKIFAQRDGFAIFDGEKTIRWYRAP